MKTCPGRDRVSDADADGDLRHQTFAGSFEPRVEVFLQGAADHADGDVLDRRCRRALDHPFDLGQRKADTFDDAVRRYRVVETGARRREIDRRSRFRCRAKCSAHELPGAQAHERAAARGHIACERHGRTDGVGRRPRREIDERRRVVEKAAVLRRRRASIGRELVHRREELHRRDAAEGGEVGLEEQCEAVGRQAVDVVQLLDDVALPQRAAAIERARVQPGHLGAQLAPVARFGQCDVAHVEFDVESRIVDPVWPRNRQRQRGEPPAEDAETVRARSNVALDVGEIDLATRRRRPIVDRQRRRVHRHAVGLEPQVETFESGQAFHRRSRVIRALKAAGARAGSAARAPARRAAASSRWTTWRAGAQ